MKPFSQAFIYMYMWPVRALLPPSYQASCRFYLVVRHHELTTKQNTQQKKMCNPSRLWDGTDGIVAICELDIVWSHAATPYMGHGGVLTGFPLLRCLACQTFIRSVSRRLEFDGELAGEVISLVVILSPKKHKKLMNEIFRGKKKRSAREQPVKKTKKISKPWATTCPKVGHQGPMGGASTCTSPTLLPASDQGEFLGVLVFSAVSRYNIRKCVVEMLFGI